MRLEMMDNLISLQWPLGPDARLGVFIVAANTVSSFSKTSERDEYATLSAPIAKQTLNWYFGPGVEPKVDGVKIKP